MAGVPGTASQIFTAVKNVGANVIAISQVREPEAQWRRSTGMPLAPPCLGRQPQADSLRTQATAGLDHALVLRCSGLWGPERATHPATVAVHIAHCRLIQHYSPGASVRF